MARFDPHSMGLALVGGGLVLGGALAIATPTRMKAPAEPEWRATLTSGRQPIDEDADRGTYDASRSWFAADTYEVLPAIGRAARYAEATLPPADVHFADSHDDDGDWRQIDAEQVTVAQPGEETPVLVYEDDEPAHGYGRPGDRADEDGYLGPAPPLDALR